MNSNYEEISVYFEDPFWVGVIEKYINGKLSVCKITFGAEPTNNDVYNFMLKNYDILKFSPAVDAKPKVQHKNPKRIQREARKAQQNIGIGTKSQQALSKQYEENKLERKAKSKEKRLAEQERQYQIRKDKKREKHKGH